MGEVLAMQVLKRSRAGLVAVPGLRPSAHFAPPPPPPRASGGRAAMGGILVRAGGVALGLVFLIVAAGPAAAQYIESPEVLYKDELNGAQVVVNAGTDTFATSLQSSWFTVWDNPSGVTMSITNLSRSSNGKKATLTLGYSGDFTSDWSMRIHVTFSAFQNAESDIATTLSGGSSLPVRVTRPALQVGSVSGQATEAGGQATFPVRLTTQPSQAVTVSVSSQDPSEGAASPSSLTFSTTSWNTNQTVTVTGADDTVHDGAPSWNVRLDPSSGDSDYNALSTVDVAVTTTDDETLPTVSLALSSSSISENGGVSTVSARLSGASSEAVTLSVSASPGSGTDFTRTGTMLTFAAGSTTSAGVVTITAVNNDTDAPNKSVTVSATAAGGNGVAAPSNVTLTITDDDAAPGATLSLNPASISENGGTSAVSATLSRPSSAATTVTVTAVPGFYTVGSGAVGTIVFAAGATTSSDTATITAVSNDTDAPDRSETVTGSMANDQGTGSVTGATLTIPDDDAAPGAALSLSPSSISENAGTSAVSAVLSHPSSAASTVTVTAVPGFYTVGPDATIVIAAGDTTAASDTAAITAAGNDDVHSGNRSVTVTGTLSNDQGAGSVTGVSLTLEDDETLPTVSLALSPSSISENGGVSTVGARLSGKSSQAVTVTVSAAAGTGAVAADFTRSASNTLTIAAGSTTSSGVVTVRANDNADASGSKQVVVSGASAGGNGVAAPSDATLTITDDDTPQVTLVLSSPSIGENGGEATVTARLDRQSSVAVTVTVSAAAVSPAVSGDFSLSSANTLTFAANATASAGTVTVTAVDNDTDAPDKRVTVSGTSSDSLGLANDPSPVTLRIADDDAAPGAALSLNPSSIAENGGTSAVSATLSHPSSAASTVTVTAVSGFYTVGSGATGTIVFAVGATTSSDTATITAVEDDVHQGSGGRSTTVTGTLSNDQGAGSVTGVSLTLTEDDAAPTVSLALSSSSISENGGVSRVGARLSGKSSQAVTVTVSASPGTGAVAADFTLSSANTLTIGAGSTVSAGTVTVRGADNDVDADGKQVVVSGTAVGGHGVATPSDVTLTITDDDTAGLSVSRTAGLRTTEAGGRDTFTVALSSEPVGDVVLDVASSDPAQGTVSPSSLTFTASDWSTAQTVTLTGVDDDPPAVDGSQAYTVTVTVDQADTADARYDPVGAVTVSAVNRDDEAGVEVAPVAGLRTTEAGGTATFEVSLIGAPTGSVTLPMTSSDESEGVVSPGSVTFTVEDWETARTVTVRGVDDGIDDGEVSYTIVTGDPASADAFYDALSGEDVDDVSVVNEDDEGAPSVVLSVSSSSISENGGETRVTASLSHPSSSATTVTVAGSSSGGFEVSGGATLTIGAGTTTSAGTVLVRALDNEVDAPDAEVTVGGSAVNAMGIGGVAGAPLVLVDDDEAGLVLSRTEVDVVVDPDAGVGESGYVVSLGSEPTGGVTVTIESDNADVSVSPATLAFGPSNWGAPQTVTVAAAADADDEADAAVLSHAARGGGYDGVPGRVVEVAVSEPGDDRVAVREAGRRAAFRVGARRVVVETADAADAEDAAGFEAALEGFVVTGFEVSGDTGGEPPVLRLAPVSDDAPMERGASGWGAFGFGPPGSGPPSARSALDVSVSGVARLSFCLPVPGEVEAAAAGSALRLLHHDGSGWEVVAGSGLDAEGTRVCASGVTEFSSFAVGWENAVPSWDGVERAARGPYVAGSALPPGLALPAAAGGDAPVRYTLVGPDGAALPDWLRFDADGTGEGGTGCPGAAARALCGTPPAGLDDVRLAFTLVAADAHGDRTEPGLAVELAIEEDRAPAFADAEQDALHTWTVDEPIDPPPALPEAIGGNPPLAYADAIAPAPPPGVVFDPDGSGGCGTARTLCGTPTEIMAETAYTWTVTDRDGDRAALRFRIEVVEGREPARARLAALNRSILPEVSRAMWDSALEAVTVRLESSGAGGGSGASGEGPEAALAGFLRANERTLEEDGASWEEWLRGRSFAMSLGGEGAGTGLRRPVTVWGAGERRGLSRDVPALEWSGDLFATHLGADAGFGPRLTGGFSVSRFESLMDYVDRSEDEPVEGVHRTRMASVQPYVGWSSEEGSRLWASAGYGSGEVEIVDQDLLERFGRQRSDGQLLAAAAGGALRVAADGGAWLDLKGQGQATRYEVDENGDLIAGLAVHTRRLRFSAQGTREYVVAGGGRVAPSAELGVRWDGGDGARGAGVEVGGGLSWTAPARGVTVQAAGRWLAAHRSEVHEWGLSGGVRFEPRANGRGLSLSVEPSWGEARSGTARLWQEGTAGRGETARVPSGAALEAEAGYGLPAFGTFAVATPYTRFVQAREGARRYGLGWRLNRTNAPFALDLEAWRREHDPEPPRHGITLDLRLHF